MAPWTLLGDLTTDALHRGTVFKFRASYPFEPQVAMMLAEWKGSADQGNSCLITITGYKAGIVPYVILPKGSGPSQGSVWRQWLIQNWTIWIDTTGDSPERVLVCETLNATDLI